MWSPKTGWMDAETVLKENGLTKMELGPKEGLALINGTQMVSSLGALAVQRAENIARQADVISALTLDVLKGTTQAYDAKIHRVRPHKGQNDVARRLRSLLHSDLNPSEIAESHRNCGKVQDAYTLRCVPQVHGIVHETIEFCKGIITRELNSATDNPLIFPDQEQILSGGNFHGEYPAKALDFLAIAVHELAQMSERRLERLVNHELSGLPTKQSFVPSIIGRFNSDQLQSRRSRFNGRLRSTKSAQSHRTRRGRLGHGIDRGVPGHGIPETSEKHKHVAKSIRPSKNGLQTVGGGPVHAAGNRVRDKPGPPKQDLDNC
uniref:Phenylalanine ammonia-lyase n=1 Tax=Panagrolaimus sp. JU765 TaxID=591449 RepID=A0AC34Q1S7_9BILA